MVSAPQYLQVNYSQHQYWSHRLLSAINNKPVLHAKHAEWPDSDLSDLAFSITTRLGALQELVHLVDEALNGLGQEMDSDPILPALIAGGYAYDFDDMTTARRALVLLSAYATEGLSLFDNLVEFYRKFLEHYFDERVTKADAEQRIRGMTNNPQWHMDLVKVRNHLVNRFAPWLAFEISSGPRRFEPVLVHDWRPETLRPDTSTSLAVLREIKAGLNEAANRLPQELILKMDET